MTKGTETATRPPSPRAAAEGAIPRSRREPRRKYVAAGLLSACVLTAGVGAAASTPDDQSVTVASMVPLSEGKAIRLDLAPLPMVALTTTTTATTTPPTTAAPAPVTTAQSAAPVPARVPAPAPEPAPVVEPAPEPIVEPAPEPIVEPAPEPEPAPSGSVEEAIYTFFPDVYDQAIHVASCESGMNPGAISGGGGNWGLFQINTVHRNRVAAMGYSWDQLLDPYVNSHVARSIYDESGWRPWACRP